ncbi:MAG: hypothetical protein LBP53_01625 [Candidatus Peribacteria bacterium]|jgi:hypothetical protein|nr:hypothetical protein [Candidatus Peribacteria bacterium]
MYDNNPFLNANFWELTINDYRVAVFLSTRNPMNYAMIDFWINIELIENLCKKIKKETQKEQ